MTYDPTNPAFFDGAAVDKELVRVTEICDGCRRCHRLCPSFDFMLERIDAHDGDIAKIAPGDYRRIVDLCYQCKLCFNHCPYTPPHRFDIDFPRLMLRAKAARAKVEGVTRQDRWLGNPDRVGSLGCATAPLSNWANAFPPARAVLEATVGIAKGRTLPKFHHKTFARWFRERKPKTGGAHEVALFYTCLVNYNEPRVGRDATAVLEHNGCAVSCPEQVCCGMPYLDAGDVAGATANAKRNLAALAPRVEAGADVVVPQPTCSYVIKKEWPDLVPGEESRRVAARTFDLFEFLVGRHREGALDTKFPGKGPGKVAYHVPCHLRAQNMGFKTRDVLQLIPGTKVSLVERCTAMDGTWGMKKEYYPLSLTLARKVAQEMEASQPDTYVSDCSLAALQVEDVRGSKPEHPATLLRRAYDLPAEN